MKDTLTFTLGSVEIQGIKLNDISCTYSVEGTKEEYSEIADKILNATMQMMDKINNINNNNKESK